MFDFHDYNRWLKSENLSSGTIRNHLSILHEFEKFCVVKRISINDLSVSTVRDYMAWLAERPSYQSGKQLATGTRAKHYDSLKRLSYYLIERGLLTRSLTDGVRRPIPRYAVVHSFSQQQIQAILDAVKMTRSGPQYQERTVMLLFTLISTGIRISEVLRLKPEEIDLNRRMMTVLGKGNKEREVPLSWELTKALSEYIEKYRIERQGYLFASRYGKPLASSSIRDILRRVRLKIGPEHDLDRLRVSPHTFRHSFAKLWVVKGGNTIALSRILGHTGTQMTDKYVRLWGVDLNDSYDICNPCAGIKMPK